MVAKVVEKVFESPQFLDKLLDKICAQLETCINRKYNSLVEIWCSFCGRDLAQISRVFGIVFKVLKGNDFQS